MNATISIATYVSSRIKNDILHTFQCSDYQSGLNVLLNMERLHKHFRHTRRKNTNSNVPLLFLLLCFKQHMIPTASITPTAAMTPMTPPTMMTTKTDIQQYKLVTHRANTYNCSLVYTLPINVVLIPC